MRSRLPTIGLLVLWVGVFAPGATAQVARVDTVAMRYEAARAEIGAMLAGRAPLSFKRAVYLTENAYLDGGLDWAAFDTLIAVQADAVRALAQTLDLKAPQSPTWAQLSPQRQAEYLTQLRLNAAIYAFMTDARVGPDYQYDFEDFAGERDWRQMLVAKLLVTGKGNCHSLPFLYKILADEVGAEAYLSLAPNHLYIQHHDYKQYEREWYNVELTNRSFPMDAWLVASGYITVSSLQTGLWMDTLGTRRALTLCLVDLAKGYTRKSGDAAAGFVEETARLALQHYPENPNARLLLVECLRRQYLAPTRRPQVEVLQELTERARRLVKDGYREMPLAMYQDWLGSLRAKAENVTDTTNKHRYDNRAAAPDWYTGDVLSLSLGRYDEAPVLTDSVVQVGGVRYNQYTGQVVAVLTEAQRIH